MAAILLLEDGRGLRRSNIGYCGMLTLISSEVSNEHALLRLWLADKAQRTSPFCEFDLRGLSERDRSEFWAASQRGLASLIAQFGPESQWSNDMYAGESLAHLLRMHRSIQLAEPASALNDLAQVVTFDGKAEGLNEIWGSGQSTHLNP